MPFTLVHPAVAAPLARRGLILSAVAVGSMAPDFEYFLRLSFASRWSHTLAAIPVFTLPAGLIGLWVFHSLLKAPLLRLLPPAHRQRLVPLAGPFVFGPWRRFVLVMLSCLAGIGTHLLFDAFTHEEGFVVHQWPLLARPAFHIGDYSILICEVLQHGLTALFLLAIACQYVRWFTQHTRPAALFPTWAEVRPQLPAWVGLGAITCCAALLHANAVVPRLDNLQDLRVFSGRAILAGLSAFVVSLVIVGRMREWSTPACAREEN